MPRPAEERPLDQPLRIDRGPGEGNSGQIDVLGGLLGVDGPEGVTNSPMVDAGWMASSAGCGHVDTIQPFGLQHLTAV